MKQCKIVIGEIIYMPRNLKIFVTLILLTCTNSYAELTLKELRTASKDVLALVFTSDIIDINEADISNTAAWKINRAPAKGIYKYVMQADPCDHHIYIKTEPLKDGKEYLVETPYGDKRFVFNSADILCESIKVNQAGYSALSKTRYANFAIWLGTGGSQKIDGNIPGYEVIQTSSGKSILKGQLNEIGNDESSGDFVYRIDLSKVPEGGPYKIVVEGYGASYLFGVGGEFLKRAAYLLFRAQYLQRCGCPIHNPDIREKPCHTIIYDVDGPIGEANIEVKGNEREFRVYGGYHDAGDADRRAYHISNPIINLMIYEAFPEYFYDNQYDIPGEFDSEYNIKNYTNNIPDIIDEAEWGALPWEYLQNEDGSVHFGTETKGYPEPFAAPMDRDTKKYGTVAIDARATTTCAGLFMHLARIIKPYKPEKSAQLFDRAERALKYSEKDMAAPERLYYFIQKYLLTGSDEAHQKVKELYRAAEALKKNIYATPGYSLNDAGFDNPAYIYSYIVEKRLPVDPEVVQFFTNAIKEAADSNIDELRKHAYPIGNNSKSGGWGHNVRQPLYACAPMLYYRLSGDQEYLDAASEFMDYKLGLNPLNISYVTGLGFNKVHNPHDRESAYTISKGQGPKPGITVFGPGIPGWSGGNAKVIPSVKELASERLYVDDRELISFNEFTIFETMTHDALYTVLANGGKWDGEDPYK
jgi:endoglucanase